MPHYDTIISSKGRLILPADLRRVLGIAEGDELQWEDKGDYPALKIWPFRERLIREWNLLLGPPPESGIFCDSGKDVPVLEPHEIRELSEQYAVEEYEREFCESMQEEDGAPPSLLPSAETRVTTKGQITMPEPFRRKYGVGEGDIVVLNDEIDHLSVQKSGDILARVAGSLLAYAGNGPTEIDQDQIWADIAKERDERIQSQVVNESGVSRDHD